MHADRVAAAHVINVNRMKQSITSNASKDPKPGVTIKHRT